MGVSCRQQIEHGTGRNARHLAEVLAERCVGREALYTAVYCFAGAIKTLVSGHPRGS